MRRHQGWAHPAERITAGIRHKIAIIDQRVGESGKGRDPELPLLLKEAALARNAGDEADLSFLQEDEKTIEQPGRLLITFGPGELEYVSAFSAALKQLRDVIDAAKRQTVRNTSDGLVKAVFPGLNSSARKTAASPTGRASGYRPSS